MEINKVCVLGVGTIGYQIAQIVAQNGYTVVLRDIEEKLLEQAENNITKNLQKFFVDKGKICQIYEGTNEIMRLVIAKNVLKKG